MQSMTNDPRPGPIPMMSEFKEFALSLADATAGIVTSYFNSRLGVDLKADGSPVTIADKECERILRERIASRFPNHGILGEEYGSVGLNAEYTWVLDPIDGTKSFIAGGFDFGTLIGLLKNGQPILGVISQPVLGHIIVGDNRSCTFNGVQVRVKTGCPLSEALCLLTDITLPTKFQNARGFDRLVGCVGAVRTWGNCFGYSLLVRGLANAMIDPIMSPWDLLPLIPIVRGAGGIITDYQGKDPIGAKSIIAASPDLHGEIIKIVNNSVS